MLLQHELNGQDSGGIAGCFAAFIVYLSSNPQRTLASASTKKHTNTPIVTT
jgi:hypothetical protein